MTFTLLLVLAACNMATAQPAFTNGTGQEPTAAQNAQILRAIDDLERLSLAFASNSQLNGQWMQSYLNNELFFRQQMQGDLSNIAGYLSTNGELRISQSTLVELSNLLAVASAPAKGNSDPGFAAYRETDLKFKRWQLVLTGLSLVSLIVATRALVVSEKGIRRAEREWITRMLFDCDKVLIDKPDLWFIWDSSDCTRDHCLLKSHDPKQRAQEDAFLYQHFNMFAGFDFSYGLEPAEKKLFESRRTFEYRLTWRRYVLQLFRDSKRARDLWKKEQTKEVYSGHFYNTMNRLLESAEKAIPSGAETREDKEFRKEEVWLSQFRVVQAALGQFSPASTEAKYWTDSLTTLLKENLCARDIFKKRADNSGFSKEFVDLVNSKIAEFGAG